MNDNYRLIVFFDGPCGPCINEIQAIKIHNTEQRLKLVDYFARNFDDSQYRAQGATREAMTECLQMLNSQQKWIKGVSAFQLIYRTLGLPSIASYWGARFTRLLAENTNPLSGSHRCCFTDEPTRCCSSCGARRDMGRP